MFEARLPKPSPPGNSSLQENQIRAQILSSPDKLVLVQSVFAISNLSSPGNVSWCHSSLIGESSSAGSSSSCNSSSRSSSSQPVFAFLEIALAARFRVASDIRLVGEASSPGNLSSCDSSFAIRFRWVLRLRRIVLAIRLRLVVTLLGIPLRNVSSSSGRLWVPPRRVQCTYMYIYI